MATYDAQIRVGADISPAERAVGKLTQGLDKVERLAKGALDGLKTGRINFDTRSAEQQLVKLQRGIRGLSQTVRVRVIESIERQQQQGGNGAVVVAGGGGRSPLSGLAAGAGVAAAQQRRIQPPAQALREINAQGDAAQARASEQIAAAYNTRATALAKVETQQSKVAEAQRQLNLAEAGFADKGKSVAQTINNKRRSLEGLTNWLERYRNQLQTADDDLQRLVTFQDKLTAALNRTSAAADGANRRLQMEGKNAELARTGGLSFDERLAQRRRRSPLPATSKQLGQAAAAGVGAVGLSIPGLDAVVGGAGLGFAAGGPAGAAVGAAAAAITAAGAAAARAGGQIATFYGELSKARIALAGISTSNEDYKRSIDGIADVVDRLNLPLKESTEQYTRLRAATAAVGLDASKTVSIFKSLASANAALGGNAERLNGILLATTQIFSKGKVSAEELRGQLGERLAGAFADFAKASGKSTAELDAALEKGEVSLEDFVAFSDYIGKKYGKNAEVMAKSSESAGDRLQKAWEKLQVALGPLLQSIGASIQDFATRAINAITPLVEKLEGLVRSVRNNRLYQIEKQELPAANRQLQTILSDPAGLNNPQNKQALQFQRGYIKTLQDEAKELRNLLNPKPTRTGGTTTKPDLGGGPDAEELEKRRRAELGVQSELRQLAQQRVAAELEAGRIGKDRLSQLYAEGAAMQKLLRLELDDISASDADKRVRAGMTETAIAVYQRDGKALTEEINGVIREITELGLESQKLRQGLLGSQLEATESPLQTAVRGVREELQSADQQAEQLLIRLRDLAGTNPEAGPASAAIGNLRGDIAETDPNKLASQRLTKGDAENLAATNRQLEQQIAALKQGRTEISGLQQLIANYGADWEALDPAVKAHLVNLQRVNDSLSIQLEKLQQVRADADAISGITINGIQEALVASVTGGDIRAAFSNLFSQLGDQFLTMAFRPIGEILSREIAKLLGLALVDSTQTAAVSANTGVVAALTPAVVGQTSATVANTAAVTANTAALTAQAGGNAASAVGGLGGILGNIGGLFGGSTAGLGAAASGIAFNPIAFTPGLSFFAEGGIVTGPTNAIIGEKGPEAVIPLSRMGEAMQRFNPGKAEERKAAADGSGDGTSGGANLNLQMSFQTTRFMDRDWVDKEQLQMAMYQATKQGGELGEARALRKLQHSASARRKLGMA